MGLFGDIIDDARLVAANIAFEILCLLAARVGARKGKPA